MVATPRTTRQNLNNFFASAQYRVLRGLAFLCFVAYLPAIIAVCAGNYPFGGDAVAAFGPWHEFTQQSLRQGVLPLWNPHHFCGQPFLGNGQSTVLYPPNIVYWLPLTVALLTDAMLHNLLLMCGAYVLARALGMERLAAWCVAAAIGLGGSVAAHINDGHMTWHAVRAYLPWELWALLCYLRTGNWRYAFGLSILFALQIAAGHPPMVLLSVGLCCGLLIAWGVSRVISKQRSRHAEPVMPRGWISAVIAVAFLTAALSAVNILPLREVSRLSVHGSGLSFEQAVMLSGTWRSFVRLFFPGVFGGNSDNAWGIAFGAHEEAAYIGLLALILAIGAPVWARRVGASAPPRAVWWLWALLPIAAVLSLGDNTPLYRWLFDNIALLRLVRLPVRWLEMFYLMAALLAGFALDGWLRRTRAAQQDKSVTLAKSLRVLPGILGAIALLCVVAGVACAAIAPQSPLWTTYAQWNATRRPPDERLIVAVELQSHALMACVTGLVMSLGSFVLCRKLLLPAAVNAGERQRNELALVGLITLDVLLVFWLSGKQYRQHQIQTLIAWPSEITRQYRPGQRWSTQGSGGSVNAGLSQGIDLLNGYDPMSGRRYFQFARGMGAPHWRENFQLEKHPPLVRVAGVTHVLKYQFEDVAKPVAEGVRRARSGKFELWELPPAWPRAYLSRRVLRVPQQQEITTLQQLAKQPFNLALAPVTVAPENFSDVAPSPLRADERVVKWQRANNTINLETQAAAPSVLVVSEAWVPGWRAWVAGPSGEFQPVPIETGNFLFRVVKVPAGQARVAMAYDSSTFRVGLFLSLCGLAAVAAVVFAHLPKRRAN